MAEVNLDDYLDYDIFYTVRPYPTASFDCAGISSAPSHIHVRFSHYTAENEEVESRTICLEDDLLAEGSEFDCWNFIYSELPLNWPIHGDTLQEIFEEVIEKARQFKCNLGVDIGSVLIPNLEDDFGVNGSDGGGSLVKSLKRKRIEEGGNCCVICLEELTTGRDVAVMPCGHHSFYDDCLSSWLERSPSCPLCRRKISDSSS
ncbi:E3 ubiquitin-protein ligase RNF126-like [Ipomoea triloba]|uniref:E3 ubiquitin-protein ligase RNF126-like n=1 Tax=Ipomoea triloba TaxID=35885 RepID=UPI00125DE32F|nr:E3 ubiquitin-protein ligase RNF126-like [Ipomoea triloba]